MSLHAVPRCDRCAARDTALCSALDDVELTALHAIGRRRRLSAGQVLVWEGDPAAYCANLVAGVLKIVRPNRADGEQIVGLLFPGDFVGQLFVETATETIVALGDVDICLYPRAGLEQVLKDHPAVARGLLLRGLSTLADARKGLLLLGRKDAQERVAAFLLDMARRIAREAEPFDLPMSRQAIGEVLGLTIETVSRQITLLRDAGVIGVVGSRGIRILDRDSLTQRAGY